MMNTFHNQAGIFPAYIAIDSIGGISFVLDFTNWKNYEMSEVMTSGNVGKCRYYKGG